MEIFTWSKANRAEARDLVGNDLKASEVLARIDQSVTRMASQNAPTIFTPIGKKRLSRSNHWM